MARATGSFIDRLMQRRSLAFWSKAARNAPQMDDATLRGLQSEARVLSNDLDRILHIAAARFAAPVGAGDGIDRPLGCDWTWRPELWCGPVSPAGFAGPISRTEIGTEVTLFHDCPKREFSLRQFRNIEADCSAPYALALDVFAFEGSLLSLALAMPASMLDGLRRNHLIRLTLDAQAERPLGVRCRLNIRHGPNTAQVIRDVQIGSEVQSVDFDLSAEKLNEKRLENAWIDLIFDKPGMNRVVLRDLTVVRHPRAEI